VSERIHERFKRLCEIPSITEDERAVQDWIAAELREMGWEVAEDDAAGPARAGAGNLTVKVPPAGGDSEDAPWTMFAAHVDTVPHEGPIDVVERDGVFYSAGDTILGADNKAAVTVLMEMAALWAEGEGPPAGVELLFTVAEEQGLRGAHAYDVSTLRADTGFVLDHATPIGEVITAAPTYKKLIADFKGVEAHAGLVPEEGRSAIAAAAAAVAAMKLGRIDDETTTNIGLIEGGSAPNVVAGSCRITAESRAVEPGRAEEIVMDMVAACQWAAGEHGCDVDVEISENFRGYRVKPGSKALAIARGALEACDIEPIERSTGGGSDANAFRSLGFEALLLANGTEANHTSDESVSREAMELMLSVCLAAVDEASRC
jgi:tripeptide aminopeptidase